MMIQNSADAIGQYDYEHWTGKPVTPHCHEVAYVPQSIADGWEAYCSCGQWRGYQFLAAAFHAASATPPDRVRDVNGANPRVEANGNVG